jgi:hypothetical protein
MSDTIESLRQTRTKGEENLRMIEERESGWRYEGDNPLQYYGTRRRCREFFGSPVAFWYIG